MKTINSLSGGKTSSYLAVHYPANHEIFSLILIDDKKCSPKDKGLIKIVSDKIGKQFIATGEDDKTLLVMLKLEQKIGREIIWVTGESFDELIKRKKYLPNQMTRFCTTELKMKPIFEWWKKNINEKVIMRIGYRYDEQERKDNFSTFFHAIIGKSKSGLRNKWAYVEWREGEFNLIDDKINHWHINKYWIEYNKYAAENNKIDFPPDNNCKWCFWKDVQQLRKNWEDAPEKLAWAANLETPKMRWKKETTYDNIAKIGLQSDFNFGTGSGCQSGYCTD